MRRAWRSRCRSRRRSSTQAPPTSDAGAFVIAAAEQVVVGASLGFITALFFAAVQAAGNMIDLFGGFSVAFAFDPFAISGTAVFGRFYNILATALLFATDGYAMIVRGFTTSYRALPRRRGLLVRDAVAAAHRRHRTRCSWRPSRSPGRWSPCCSAPTWRSGCSPGSRPASTSSRWRSRSRSC